ncbi:MAG TPA: hypothetical protein VKX16_12090 [Chloroflexota bacterium]|nr:hypothetical protein [Chloroflexota bacterium]
MEDQEQRRAQIRERQEQLQKRISQVLQRAVDDPEFRQQLMDDPRAVLGGPRADGAAGGPAAEVPPRVKDLRRNLLREVFDRAMTDDSFRGELADNPHQAIWQAGFGPQLEQIRAELPQEEVQAFGWTWNTTLWGSIPAYLATGTPWGA